MTPYLKWAGLLVLVLIVSGFGVVLTRRPSNQRDWTGDLARLPRATFDGQVATVENVRAFDHRSETERTESWETRRFDLSRLESVWYWVIPFGAVRGPAHTFVSFGFAEPGGGTRYVAVSVEARKEKGESYDPLKGVLRRYELVYVVADERDVVRLRTKVRKDSVFLYRVQTTPEKGRELFRAMLDRANRLHERPEFYNTLTSSCTTNIVDHVNAIAPERVPFSYKYFLPAYADELAYDIGLLARDRPFTELRKRAWISGRALELDGDPDFSQAIRAGL
jgi:hypothetical protein